MTAFGKYSHYYDRLNNTKDYVKEISYVSRIIGRNAHGALSLLDLGCGTGIHALGFARAGYNVLGVDRNAIMLEQARRRVAEVGCDGGHAEFSLGDIRYLALSCQFDVIIALFHVISYLNNDEELESALRVARRHLVPNGVFVFDFWYGPGVLTDPPARRVKSYEDHAVKIRRTATPMLRQREHLVNVHYEFCLLDKDSDQCERFTENHTMRYFFRPELERFLQQNGLQVLEFNEWLSDLPPNEKTWNAVIVAGSGA